MYFYLQHRRFCVRSPLQRSVASAEFGVVSERESELKNVQPFSEIPGPKGVPFLGTLFQYSGGIFQKYSPDRYQDALQDRYKQYGKIMKETIAGVTAVRLFDPDYVRIVYQNEGKIPHVAPLLDTTKQYREQRDLSLGLGNTNGDEWYRLRSAVQQMMMRPKAVTVYLPFVEEVADDFVARIKTIKSHSGDIPNFRNELARWNLESSGMTCFETRFGCLNASPDSHVQKMIDSNNEIFVLSTKLMFSIPFHKIFNSPTWKKLLEAEDYFFGNGQKLVDETVAKIDRLQLSGQLNDDQYNFLCYLLSRKELSFKDVSIITLSLFGDGLNTTVPSFLFALYCLAKNPVCQERAYQEVCQHVKDGSPVTGEVINKLTYLKACVKESQRFFPIGQEIKRIPQKDLIIGGYHIPAGTIVELCTSVLFQSPDHFIEPKTFIPDRWLRDGSAHNIHPYLLTPFGHGPRMCAGRRFAEQEIYVLLSKLLKNFKMEYNDGELDQKFQILMVPDRPATFTFIDRQ
ncbi:hypothetical protein FSP39_019686 [Pinctada imbricata]|uniref:Cytochrome P450 CYP44 n=1 Tax=Pinctada imbricata TaxID=66713 RepID=A0AA88YE63_PINIB|nr:hypothetical protein FSP39_019686 [Pinctada imbricata]